jgi:ATP-dependent DNA ligase
MMYDIPVVEDEQIVKGGRRKGIMLCYPFEAKRLERWKSPYIIQPKLDGVRCRAIISNGYVQLLSSEERVIDLVPHINKALSEMIPSGIVELDGELYCHGMSFEQIYSITSRSKNYHPNANKIQYHIFDIICRDQQIYRTSELNKQGFFKTDDTIHIVESSLVRDLDEIMLYFHRYIDKGYEGFVIRDKDGSYQRKRYTGIMKFKPHQTDLYLIIGTQEEISITGEPKGTLGAFICTSTEGTVFNVGTGLTYDQRVLYWKERESLTGLYLKVKYQSLTQSNRVPRFPVALEVVGRD